MLPAMGLLAFVVGIFLTYNALAFSYTDRRELLRKLQLSGVTRRELTGALLVELSSFLAAGSLIGFWLGASPTGIFMEFENLIRTKVRGIQPMRSLDYRSGSVRLNDFDNKIRVSLIQYGLIS